MRYRYTEDEPNVYRPVAKAFAELGKVASSASKSAVSLATTSSAASCTNEIAALTLTEVAFSANRATADVPLVTQVGIRTSVAVGTPLATMVFSSLATPLGIRR